MNPLVSIIIPSYNSAGTLRKTLEAACKQSWRHLEVIVIDDGSIDASADVAKTYPDSRVRLIRSTNRGACRARNLGLHVAKGDYIQFLDADDLIEDNKIESQIEALTVCNSKRLVAYGPWCEFIDGAGASIRSGYSSGRSYAEPMEWLFDAMQEGFYLPPHCWLVPTEVAVAAGDWDERLLQNQDGEYFSRVLAAASGLVWVRNASAYYRVGNEASVSQAKGPSYTNSLLLAADLIRDRMLDYLGDDSTKRRKISALYLRILYRIDGSNEEDVRRIWREVEYLGLPPRSLRLGGSKFRMLRRVFGWKTAFFIKRLMQS
ncbi:MAG: glycosyltransferase family 2 protein [Planctomycetes bacterium]|jgi:glycosyltransferase involved in cell wall biosynthesis|nr:glycosyltransferase family 2 protein [Planctomycetota bacterium]